MESQMSVVAETEVIVIDGHKAEVLDRLEDILAGLELACTMLLRNGGHVVARTCLLEEAERLRTTINYVASNIADDV